jgi:hypothetical protein
MSPEVMDLIHPESTSHQLVVGTRERQEEKANAHTYIFLCYIKDHVLMIQGRVEI